MWIKKGNLATAAVEQATADTPEANVGTVSNNNLSQKDNFVNNQYMQISGKIKKSETPK